MSQLHSDKSDVIDLSTATARGECPGVSRHQVADQIDAWIARTGRTPSVRELRTALGGTGSLSALSRHLGDVLADRLLEGATPDCGAPEEVLIKAMKAAMQILSKEAIGAAEDAIAQGARDANTRIAAAERLQARADEQVDKAEQERERALGWADALTDQVTLMSADLTKAREELSGAREDLTKAKYTISELEQLLTTAHNKCRALEKAEGEQKDHLDQLNRQLHSAQERMQATEADKAMMKMTLSQTTAERDAAYGTITGLELALQQAEARAEAALISAEKSTEAQEGLRSAHNETIERLTATQRSLALAEAATAQAIRERDVLNAGQNQMEDIQRTLSWLQEHTRSQPVCEE